MKIWKRILFMALAVTAFAACSGEKQETEEDNTEALKNDVMGIHDEVMPKMGEVTKLKNDILKEAEKLAEEGEEEASNRLKTLAAELEEAGNSMMTWMRQYKPNDIDEDKMKAYLDEQKVKVEEVRSKINGGIEKAKAEIEKLLEKQD